MEKGLYIAVPLSLHRINISQFRSYETLRLDLTGSDSRPAGIIVLTGANGAGKTNILEAVSLLVPGKGLRGADILDIKNRVAAATDVWAVSAEVETAGGQIVRIGTGLDRNVKRRVVRINGKDAKTQNDLSEFISAVWLTPQMDRLFIEGASARRKFLDRLVYAYEPNHVMRINRYDKTMRERMKLLQHEKQADPKWLATLEAQMAADAVAIAASRLTLLQHLQSHAAALRYTAPLFPQPLLEMTGWVEQEMATRPAVDVENALKERLAAARNIDREAGRTHDGIHRSDLQVSYADKSMPAAQCSTGEQKALLVSILLAHTLMMQAEKGFIPLLLLDEVSAHLDAARREQLFVQLLALKGQVWLTGTDKGIFSPLAGAARFLHVEHGTVYDQDKAIDDTP